MAIPEPSLKAAPPTGRTVDRSARDLGILARVGRSLLGTVDLDEQLGLVLRLATEALRADRGSVLLLDTAGDHLVIRAAEGLPPEALNHRVSVHDGIAGWVVLNLEPLVLHGELEDSRFAGINPQIESSLSLPMAAEGTVLGVLNIVRLTGGRFTEEDLTLATSLADLASVAIEKSRLYTALRDREARVSELLAAAIGAQEQERRRIAADIHDGFLQDLAAMFLKVEMVKGLLNKGKTEEAHTALTEIKKMFTDEVAALRDFIFEVRPPSLDQIGLGATLKQMVERACADNEVEGQFIDRSGEERLPEPIEAILYRTAQEAIRNVVRHSQARRFWVHFDRDDLQATLLIRDNGRGLPQGVFANTKHFGIETMRERVELGGGVFHIATHSEGGTEVRAVIPIP
jgi:signal transduction histidine kinase